MERSELEIIKELMGELEKHMEYGEDDLGERLGRKKPEVEIAVAMQPKKDGLEGVEEETPEDELGLLEEEEETPEESLKKRLMKLRD